MQNQEILDAIRESREGRERAAKYIYNDQKLVSGIRSMVNKLSREVDFDHIFNQTIVQFLSMVVRKPEFTLGTNLNSYLYGIARHLVYQEFRKKKKEVELPEHYEAADEVKSDMHLLTDERKKVLGKIMSKLGRNCKEVLMFWASGFSMKEIAAKLDYKTEMVARKKKYQCMKSLAQYVEDRPHLKTILR